MDNKIVYVVSDSVGETADLVVRAAMGQFPFAPDIRRVPYVEDTGTLKEVISIA
ncbi:phosphoenolpyruvate synthase regulatory protein, partial [Bacillus cereus]